MVVLEFSFVPELCVALTQSPYCPLNPYSRGPFSTRLDFNQFCIICKNSSSSSHEIRSVLPAACSDKMMLKECWCDLNTDH